MRRYWLALVVFLERHSEGLYGLLLLLTLVGLAMFVTGGLIQLKDPLDIASPLLTAIGVVVMSPGISFVSVCASRAIAESAQSALVEADYRLSREMIQTRRKELGAGQLSHAAGEGGELSKVES